MGKMLTETQIEAYARDGYVFPLQRLLRRPGPPLPRRAGGL